MERCSILERMRIGAHNPETPLKEQRAIEGEAERTGSSRREQ